MKKKLLFGVTFLMIVLFCCSTYAAITFKAGLTSNTTSANPGDEISVVMNFNNLNEITTGLNAYEGVLEYDKDVFEPVTTSNFSSLNNWDSISFNENTGHFLSAKNDGITSQEDIVKITLKVKSDSKIGNTTISIKNIQASEGISDLSTDDVSISIDVQEKSIPDPTPDPTPDSNQITNTDNSSIHNTSNSLQNNIISNSTTSKESLPKAGMYYFILPTILALVAISIFSYIKYTRM